VVNYIVNLMIYIYIYVCVCVILMLSYILLELNFLLYNVPVLEAPHPGRQPKQAVLKRLNPYR
jgi:hypothetical protein